MEFPRKNHQFYYAVSGTTTVEQFTVPAVSVAQSVQDAGLLPPPAGDHPSFDAIPNRPGMRLCMVWSPRLHPARNLTISEVDAMIKDLHTVIDGVLYCGRGATLEELAVYEKHGTSGVTRIYATGQEYAKGLSASRRFAYRYPRQSDRLPILEFMGDGQDTNEGHFLVIWEPELSGDETS